jgi:hypothetical protein
MTTSDYYQEDSRATTALVLGILSLVLCGFLGPFAWSMGNTEIKAIDEGRRPPENRGTAQAGKVLGIISTVLLGIGLVFFVGFLALLMIGAAAS